MQFKRDATCSRMFQIRKVRIKTSKKTEVVAVSMWRCFHASSASFLACANLKIWLSVRQASLPPGNILSNITMCPPESYHTLSISSYQFLYFSYCSTKPLLEYLVLIATARPLGCKSWVTVLRCTWVSSDFLIGNPLAFRCSSTSLANRAFLRQIRQEKFCSHWHSFFWKYFERRKW